MDRANIPQPTEDSIQNHYKTTHQETHQLITAIRNQTVIGWEHILHGRISKDWEKIATTHWNKTEGIWITDFIHQTVKMAWTICRYQVENEFGTTKKSREQYMQIQLWPRIEQAYATSEMISTYHSHLLKIPLARRLLLSNKTNKRWLQHIAIAKASYHKHQLKTLLNTTKITQFFLSKNTKRYLPSSKIKHRQSHPAKRHKTNLQIQTYPRIQLTLTWQHLQPSPAQSEQK